MLADSNNNTITDNNNNITQITSRVVLIFNINDIEKFKNQKYMMLYTIGDNNNIINNNNEKCKNIIIQKLNVPSLESIINMMKEIDNYLNQSPLNFIIFLSLSSLSLSSIERSIFISLLYLLHIGKFTDPLSLLNHNEIYKPKIPSFIRYIYYYHHLLKTNIPINIHRYRLKFIRINTIPYYTNDISEGGCHPYIIIETIGNNGNNDIIYNQKLTNPETIKSYKNNIDRCININFDNIFIHLQGDICMKFYNNLCSNFMFKICFHTAFLSNDKYLKFERKVIDFVNEDDDLNNFNINRNHRIFDKDFNIEIFVSKAVDNLNNDCDKKEN
jgi:hypothetical protein